MTIRGIKNDTAVQGEVKFINCLMALTTNGMELILRAKETDGGLRNVIAREKEHTFLPFNIMDEPLDHALTSNGVEAR